MNAIEFAIAMTEIIAAIMLIVGYFYIRNMSMRVERQVRGVRRMITELEQKRKRLYS